MRDFFSKSWFQNDQEDYHYYLWDNLIAETAGIMMDT